MYTYTKIIVQQIMVLTSIDFIA